MQRDPTVADTSPSTSRLSRALLVFAGLLAAALIFAVVQGLFIERENEIQNARARTQNLTRLLEEHTRQMFKRVEWVLSEAARDGGAGPAGAVAPLLQHHVERDGLMRSLLWLDAAGEGVMVGAKGPSWLSGLAERDFFAVHKNGSGLELSIGAPVTDLQPGVRLLPVSLRLAKADGKFAGVLVALIDTRHLQPQYDAIDTGRDGGVALFLRSGWLAVRAPHVEALLHRRWDQTPLFQQHLPKASVGTVRQVVVADGIERIYSYRELSDYPVVVYLGLSLADVLAPWRTRAAIALALLLLALAAAAAGVWNLLKRLREHESAAAALAAGQRFVQRITDNLPLRVAYIDAERRYQFVNDAHARMMGHPREQVIGRTRSQITGATLGSAVDACLDRALQGHTQRFEFAEGAGETRRHFEGCFVPDVDEHGRTTGVYAIAIDITERRGTQSALQAQAELRRVTLHSIADAVISTDEHGMVEFINPAAEKLCGWHGDEARGRPVTQVLAVYEEGTGRPVVHPATQCLEGVGSTEAAATAPSAAAPAAPVAAATTDFALLLVARDGHQAVVQVMVAPIRDRQGALKGAVLVLRDVTHERRKVSELAYRASHDSLTGLVNRAEFEVRLKDQLQHAAEHEMAALMFIDLDRFKQINDQAGHLAGDRMLCRVAAVLQQSVRAGDTVARLGGDEFAVLLVGCPMERARRLAEELRARVAALELLHDGRSLRVGASIGLVDLVHAGDSNAALRDADAACYAAKAAGRNSVHLGTHEVAPVSTRAH